MSENNSRQSIKWNWKDTINYRGITLLSSISKLIRKILSEKSKVPEEQQSFRQNQSTVI